MFLQFILCVHWNVLRLYDIQSKSEYILSLPTWTGLQGINVWHNGWKANVCWEPCQTSSMEYWRK